MIPKKIHYCWFGGAEKSPLIKRCINTWRKVMPDYEIKEWNEKNFDIDSVPFVKEAYQARKWAFVADYVRLHAMHEEGGIYMDTDVKVMRKFDTFLKYSFFTCQESHPDIMPEGAVTEDGQRNPEFQYVKGIGLCSAVMGAEKGNIFLQNCLEKYNSMHFEKEHQEDFVIVNIIAVQLEKFGYRYILDRTQILPGNIAIFKPNVFAGLSTLTHDSYAIHLYNGSWVESSKSLKHWLRNQFPGLYTFFQNSYYKVQPPKRQTIVTDKGLQHGMKVLQIACYAQPFMGNFIRSLTALEQQLQTKGVETVYAFWGKAAHQPWYQEFSKQHHVYLTGDNYEHSEKEILHILEQEHPDIIHTHFDGFDISAQKACNKYKKKYGKEIHQIWHLHNVKGLSQKGWHKQYWQIKFFVHYNLFGRKANIISVNTQMLKFSNYYRNLLHQTDKKKSTVILNCLDLSRIESPSLPLKRHEPFTFLSIGSRNIQKRFDTLLSAGEMLQKEGYAIRILITKGTDAKEVIDEYFHNQVPQWVQLVPEDDNINHLFSKVDCLVSTSIHETFSYTICEATVYGIPVIQSDIEGTAWNKDNPSTYLFETLNAMQLSQQMINVMQEKTEVLSRNCEMTRNTNRKNFPISKWCENVIDFYNSIVDHS